MRHVAPSPSQAIDLARPCITWKGPSNSKLHIYWKQYITRLKAIIWQDPKEKKYDKNGNFIHFCRSIFYQGGGDTPTGAGKVVHNLQEKERGIMHASILAYYRISHSKWTLTLSQLSSNSTSIPSYENGKASSKIWSAALYYFVQQEGFIM